MCYMKKNEILTFYESTNFGFWIAGLLYRFALSFIMCGNFRITSVELGLEDTPTEGEGQKKSPGVCRGI